MTKIQVLGFYHRKNLGDDVLAFVWERFFEKYFTQCQVDILNTDDTQQLPDDSALVVVGGGDLINDYFLHKITPLVQPLTCPTYALGVGIPYPDKITDGSMDIFDFIITRNQEDLHQLQQIYTPSYVRYFPDLTFLLPSLLPPTPLSDQEVATKYGLDPCKKNIAVFLARPVYSPDCPAGYETIIGNLSAFLLLLASETHPCLPNRTKYVIHLFSMNTNDQNVREADTIINTDIKNRLEHIENVHYVDKKIDIEDIPQLFSQFYLTIASRYHAHVFSIMSGTPVLSLYSTRKVESLLKSADLLKYSAKYVYDQNLNCVVDIESNKLLSKFDLIRKNYRSYRRHLKAYLQGIQVSRYRLEIHLKNLFISRVRRIRPGTVHYQNLVTNKLQLTAARIINYLQLNKERYIQELVDGTKNILTIYRHNKIKVTQKEKNTLARIISYTLIGKIVSDYNHGLSEQVLTAEYSFPDSINWILEHHYQKPPHLARSILSNTIHQSLRKFKINHGDQLDLKGYHRSGWPFVMKHLNTLHRNNGTILESYADRTFGWQSEFLAQINVIPYQKPWVGFFHHTFDESYSPNNLVTSFQNPSFQASLPQCRGLIVFSTANQNWIENRLKELGYPTIPVLCLKHPTELVHNNFTLRKFENNPERKVIQVGAWLRDTYIIFDLPRPKYLKKYALKGRAMENYYPNIDTLPKIKEALLQIGCQPDPESIDDSICRPISGPSYDLKYCNKYIAGLYQSLERKQDSVEIINYRSNEEYDKLLSENIVMVYLHDLSGCNTLIECIVRNTPILINRHPTVVEYLGDGYPFYYSSLEEAKEKLDSPWAIVQAYWYLSTMRKTEFEIDHFMGRLLASDLYQSL